MQTQLFPSAGDCISWWDVQLKVESYTGRDDCIAEKINLLIRLVLRQLSYSPYRSSSSPDEVPVCVPLSMRPSLRVLLGVMTVSPEWYVRTIHREPPIQCIVQNQIA